MNFNRSKRGLDVNVNSLVLFILLVLSFVIILLFWSGLDVNSTIDKKACSASIIMRGAASSQIFKTDFRDIVPLKCKLEALCFTSEIFGGSCESLEKNYEKINVGKDKNKMKEDIVENIAKNIYDWHVLLGKGEINFMPRKFLNKHYCLLNSKIAFDKKTQEELKKNSINITYFDIYNKLSQMKNKEGKTYFQELFGTSAQLQNIAVTSNLTIDISKTYAIITQISEEGKWLSQTSTALTVAGFLIWPLRGLTAGKAVIAFISAIPLATEVGAIKHLVLTRDPDSKEIYDYIAPALYPFDKESLEAFDCSFENLPA
jgi:hypothetical protein